MKAEQEIEIKVLNIDPAQMHQRLKDLGASYLGCEFQQNDMYDYPDRRLFEQNDGSYIRIRRIFSPQKPPEILLTLKKTRSRESYKIADETETLIEDGEAMHKFLTQLDFVLIRRDEKLRHSYSFEEIRFEIDEWAGIPPYLEIEVKSEQDILKGLNLLNLTLEDSTTKSLKEVLAMYKIDSDRLCFADFGRNIRKELEMRFIKHD